jgi:hypothetical protein
MRCIGLDPGKNTGIAVWNTNTQHFELLDTVPIHKAMEIVKEWEYPVRSVRVYFEDARKRQYLPRERNASEYRGKLMGAGSVKRDSVIWQDALTDWGIPFTMVPPRAGATKWTADTFRRITGYTGRTSNHARDAALLVYGMK